MAKFGGLDPLSVLDYLRVRLASVVQEVFLDRLPKLRRASILVYCFFCFLNDVMAKASFCFFVSFHCVMMSEDCRIQVNQLSVDVSVYSIWWQ